jgi:hypothetical protein
MKRSFLFFLCLAVMSLLIFYAPVSAEVYKYTDESGETHYTNDAESVPRQYRNDVDVEGETIIYPDEDYTSDETSDDTSSEEMTQPQGNSGEVGDLKVRQKAFDDEFKELEAERARLDKAMKNAETREELQEVNAQTMEFNNRYKDFHMRRKAFKEEVKAYNDQVRKDMEKQLEDYKKRQAAQDDELSE